MASEGKTTTAANLTVAFAQQGMRVLLVDCDLRKCRLHNVFGMSRGPGLSDVFAGTATVAENVRPAGVDRLSVVTAGSMMPVSRVGLCMLLLLGVPALGRAQESSARNGFWMNEGAGWGTYGCPGCDARMDGVAGSASLGGTVRPDLLLGVSAKGWAGTSEGGGEGLLTLTPMARYYPGGGARNPRRRRTRRRGRLPR